eukprot:CAMPEP_0170414486 /NCGR_PEP_ID=MMETSP0117_2-20130122/32093_1 /TAXON_ID=400756 /ORGANISM="Durinskia baltica, Strain CSIRO CS-38" /LENGTH=256 /DNA_ID=CAMNT_0010672377 /DNA_START=95 /DNA_END=864 /DNA_ORIENTATION=-
MAHVMLAYYYIARSQGIWAPSMLAVLALGIFIVGYSLGLGPIPWLIMSELFPTEVRGAAISIGTATNWTMSFLVTLLFEPLQSALTRQGAFLVFATVCASGFLFVLMVVPETKGKSVEQVVDELNARRRGRRARDASLVTVSAAWAAVGLAKGVAQGVGAQSVMPARSALGAVVQSPMAGVPPLQYAFPFPPLASLARGRRGVQAEVLRSRTPAAPSLWRSAVQPPCIVGARKRRAALKQDARPHQGSQATSGQSA